tara:strand:- start:214 stop:504 length:291 start_codon:yes stop_codon:yes gene_type:complete
MMRKICGCFESLLVSRDERTLQPKELERLSKKNNPKSLHKNVKKSSRAQEKEIALSGWRPVGQRLSNRLALKRLLLFIFFIQSRVQAAKTFGKLFN